MYDLKTESKGLVAHGVSTCHGCGLELGIRVILEELGEKTIIVMPPGCISLFAGYGAETALKIPGMMCTLENTAAVAAGVRAGLTMQGKEDVTVLAMAGDGGTVDIGLQALSGALERGDRILYICYDNEGYMNTGIQASGSTPMTAWTTTTPAGKPTYRKDMIEIAAAHRIPYVASASVSYPEDLRRKVAKARDCGGPAYIHLHTTCPTGWGCDPAKAVAVGELAVTTNAFPLIEIVGGKGRITLKVQKPKPIAEYLAPQDRFRGLSEEQVAELQNQVDTEYARVQERTKP